jgi:D-lactate dehydrogenase
VKIHFVETEPSEQEFFTDAFADREVSFVSKLEDVEADAEIVSVFINSRVGSEFLDAHPRLKLLTTRSTSTDHLDLTALQARGVTVSRVLHYGETTVAEHTFALILALSRRLREVMNLAQSKRAFSYDATRGFDLCGKTLGIVGMGAVGQRVAEIAHGFQMKVIAYDVEKPVDLPRKLDFEFVGFADLLARSDIITLHTTLSAENYHLLNRETFAKCKRGVLIINTARGALIETEALREALDSGQVGGAGLDVLQDERVLRDTASNIIAKDIVEHLRSDALAQEALDAERVRELEELMLGDAVLKRMNVVFTPHLAFNSIEAVARRNAVTVENIQAFLKGKAIECVTGESGK